jgi:exodeoxyribonuclease V alpha subunit
VHVALRLTALGGERDDAVALAAALGVRGPRLGHVRVDLATIRDTAIVDADEPVDVSALPWPEPAAWIERLLASRLVSAGEEDRPPVRPLRLVGTALYLDRYWREERRLAADLRTLAAAPVGGVDTALLIDGLARLFPAQDRPRAEAVRANPAQQKPGDGGSADAVGADPDAGRQPDERQRIAAAAAVRRRLAVVVGGPGTGKTTTVARIVALLAEQAARAGGPEPLVALAAPTGKAAARLEEAVHDEAGRLDVAGPIRAQLRATGASTLHRLLGVRPGGRFRHHRGNRLPHDVVVVDETSMVSLWLMARLLEAVRPEARLVLVGDPGQLASIEAGAVLADIVGPAGDGPLVSAALGGRPTSARVPDLVGVDSPGAGPASSIGDGIVVLDRVHRFGEGIARVAGAIRRGDEDEVVAALAAAPESMTWLPVDAAEGDEAALAPVRASAVASARTLIAAALAGRAPAAIAALGAFRLLCAHRRGPYGAATWMARVEGWLAEELQGFAAGGRWYVGRPLLVTENDHGLRLYNGDTGVVVATGDRVSAAFERGGDIVTHRPSRLGAVDTVYAMTVHKSQGSQFDTAAVLLPAPDSPLLTRELLYTAVTRARRKLLIVATEESVRTAVARPIARASGLRERLWGDEP